MTSRAAGTTVAVAMIVLLAAWPGRARKSLGPATTPIARDAGWWRDRVQRINREARRSRPEVILVGDSIIYGWRFIGRPVWKRYFKQLRVANLGVDRDQTGHLLWRLQNGNLAALSPKVTVLLIGANNTAQRKQSPREIAAGVQSILGEIGKRLPRTQVLLLGIFPRGRPGSAVRAKIAKSNRLIARLAGDRVHFLDISSRFLDERGRLPRAISYDGLHLSARGYTVWATAMQATLRELLSRKTP